jgi:hypothetical protein
MLTAFMIAAFHEDWMIRFAQSPHDAMARLGNGESTVLIYDWDHYPAAWREVCTACSRNSVPFYLVATMPPDDLFLAVAGAGGSGVLWKPLTTEQMTAAIGGRRSPDWSRHPRRGVLKLDEQQRR